MTTTYIANETIHAKSGEKPPPGTVEKLRARLLESLDKHGIEGEAREQALADLDALTGATADKTVEEMSAESVARAMETTSESLDNLNSALTTLAKAQAKRDNLKESFQIGDVHGQLSGARALLSLAALSLRHVYNCDCHEDEASKAETVPPPAPEATPEAS